ncbi:tRNA 4-thiouridine(8) synthase ThiI [bacterium]|nr:tRNA 4-thiouridine(8) synthase ThiI [bacterium]
MAIKAVALLSGGLDSSLAARIVLDQGVEVEGLHFVSIFNGSAPEQSTLMRPLRVARQLGIPARTYNFTREQLELVKSPPHGYGSSMNPCIDCHMAMFKRAAERMAEIGAKFLITGEVVGQRPMSQRRPVLQLICKETGLGGLLLRPLSAKLLPPSIPEQEGWVDRERLLDIEGRSRKRQIALAREYGMTEHASPAGGCLLTDPGFSARLRDLLDSDAETDLSDFHLLKVGRQFRLDAATKVVMGRRQSENGVIITFAKPADLLLTTRDTPGPTAVLRGAHSEEHIRTASALTARYSRLHENATVAISVRPGRTAEAAAPTVIDVAPITDDAAAAIRIT